MKVQGSCPYALDGTAANIHEEATNLRALGPAARVTLPGLSENIPTWSVTDPGLIRRLLTHPDVSKDAHQHWPALLNGQIPATWPLGIWVNVRNALTAYGSEHSRLRRPLAAAFTTRRVRALAPQIKTIADQLLANLQPDVRTGIVDLRSAFALQMPLLVANIVLGVPVPLHDQFRNAIGTLFHTAQTDEQAAAGLNEVYRLIDLLISQKTAVHGDDVTSALIDTHQRGDLTADELRDSLLLLVGAGHETTVNLLDHGAVSLLTHPDQLALVRSGEADWDMVVEETLRHQAPLANMILRYPTRPLTDEPTGITFDEGDALVINYAAAGRDPAIHGPGAGRFDLTRTTSRQHLSFGHGTHYCLGAELARLEGAIALEALTTHYPQLQLAVDPSALNLMPSLISNGHQEIPVRLQPA